MKTIITLALIYLFVSIIVGIVDLMRYEEQERYFMDIPYGDLEFYEPKPITGIHNWVFLPSWIVIKGWIAFVRFANKRIDG